MNEWEELKELKRKRNNINKRIKELEGQYCKCGRVKLEKRHFSTERTDELCVSFQTYDINYQKCEGRWTTMIVAVTMEEALNQIKNAINDLNELSNRLVVLPTTDERNEE